MRTSGIGQSREQTGWIRRRTHHRINPGPRREVQSNEPAGRPRWETGGSPASRAGRLVTGSHRAKPGPGGHVMGRRCRKTIGKLRYGLQNAFACCADTDYIDPSLANQQQPGFTPSVRRTFENREADAPLTTPSCPSIPGEPSPQAILSGRRRKTSSCR